MIHPTALVGAPPFSFFEDTNKHEDGAAGVFVAPDVHIQAGTVIEAGTHQKTHVSAGARIGSLVYIGHDSMIGAMVRIAAGARLAGWVTVEPGAYVGMGAMIRQHVRIGYGSVVGMGAVVLRDVPPNCIVVGNPARILRLKDAKGPDLRGAKFDGERWK